MSLFVWMLLGAAVGWLASQFMKDSAYGQMTEIALGVVGGVAGGIATGWLLGMNTASGFNVETLAGAVLVAIVAIGASRVFKRTRANI